MYQVPPCEKARRTGSRQPSSHPHPHPHLLATDGVFTPDGTFIHLGFHRVTSVVAKAPKHVLRGNLRA